NATDHLHIVVLVVAAVAATLDRLELRELLFPVTQDVRLHRTQPADLANGEVALARDLRQRQRQITGQFPHRSRLANGVSGPDGTSRRGARRSESLRRSWGYARGVGSCHAIRNCRSRKASPAHRTRGCGEPARKNSPRTPWPPACSGPVVQTALRPV